MDLKLLNKLEENHLINEDCLEFLRLFGVGLLGHGQIIKILCYSILVHYCGALVIIIANYFGNYVVISFDLHVFVVMGLYGACALGFSLLFYANTEVQCEEARRLPWNLDLTNGGYKVEREIMYEVRKIKCMVLLNSFALVLTTIPLCNQMIHNFTDIIRQVGDAIGADLTYYNYYLIVVLVVLTYSSTALGYLTVYLVIHLTIRLKIINKDMKNFCDSLRTDDVNNLKIFNFLVNIIHRHEVLKQNLKQCLKLFYSIIIIFPTCGAISSAAILLSFHPAVESTISIFTLVTTGISIVFLMYFYVSPAQSLVDESEDLYNSLKILAWYRLDKRNKFVYLMFLMHTSSESMKLSAFRLVDVDYRIIVKVCKMLYTTITIVVNLKSKQ